MTITEPLVMGILNVTPDSFYAGSRSDTTQAIEARVGQMLAEGVDIIDIGAYSTRPGAAVVTADEEKARLARATEVIHRFAPNVVTSVDTFRADVARYAVEQLGIGIVNDVSGGTLDPQMFATVADLQVPYILMHMRGTPATMQVNDLQDAQLHPRRGPQWHYGAQHRGLTCRRPHPACPRRPRCRRGPHPH